MNDLWFPGANLSRKAPSDGGSILGGKPKCLWHDTETNGIPSYSTGYFPNMTIYNNTPYQHIAANRAGRALRNETGGVQTNRWNVFQIEICGWVNKITFKSIYRDVAQWLKEVRGCPLTCTVNWLPYSSSYGATRVRLSGAAWSTYTGHLGHMHAPENSHGDPGWPFPINEILTVVGGAEDELTDDDKKWIEQKLAEYMRQGVRYTDHGDNTVPGASNHLENVRREIGELKTELAAIRGSLNPPT